MFVAEIWKWYACHKRELPWRDIRMESDMERAYRVLVSEVMLQQTQVSRIKIVYKDFLKRFPSIADLAQASNRDVLLAWRGMGYNNRALRLRDAAKSIVCNRQPTTKHFFPTAVDDLKAIPGIGHYTAAAIRNFAFNLPTPCLDTNIRRILHRVFIGPENADGSWKKDDRYLLRLAEEVLLNALRSGDARNWHAALMDFGSLVCTKRHPRWDICPLTKAGIMKAAYKTPTPSPTPKKEPGRMVGQKFVPNRIVRGKIIEELRDSPAGLTQEEIGKRVCIDWHASHRVWLRDIIEALKRDHLIAMRRGTVKLAR